MRILEPLVLIAALAAAPAAYADPVCDSVKLAAKSGEWNWHRKVSAPDGFDCKVIVERELGAYACSATVEPEARAATAKALIETIRACFGSRIFVEERPREANAVFMIGRSPKKWVVVNGAGVVDAEDAKHVYMNVVVARLDYVGGGQVAVPPPADPYGYRLQDPGCETHRC